MQSWGIGRIWTHEALSTSFTAKQIWPLSYNTVSRIIFAILHFMFYKVCLFEMEPKIVNHELIILWASKHVTYRIIPYKYLERIQL